MLTAKIKPREEFKKNTVDLSDYINKKYEHDDSNDEYSENESYMELFGDPTEELPMAERSGNKLICPHCKGSLNLDNVDFDETTHKPICMCELCYGLSEISKKDCFDAELFAY